jgi:hypothetical protein
MNVPMESMLRAVAYHIPGGHSVKGISNGQGTATMGIGPSFRRIVAIPPHGCNGGRGGGCPPPRRLWECLLSPRKPLKRHAFAR